MTRETLDIQHREDEYVLTGVLDEEEAPERLQRFAESLAGADRIVLELSGLRRITSLGVRGWVYFMRSLKGREVVFRRCSPAFVDQLNTVSDFRGDARIESVLAPFVCERSGALSLHELVIGVDISRDDHAALEGRSCDDCPEPLVLDDLPERYLRFLAIG